MSLRHGVLHALIWAPPSQFAVDTPSVRAVDLGCAYTLETQADGDGLITVQMGWVAFDHKRNESFIPAEAACRVYARRGPGFRWFQDASAELRDRFAALESRNSASGALNGVLAAATSTRCFDVMASAVARLTCGEGSGVRPVCGIGEVAVAMCGAKL